MAQTCCEELNPLPDYDFRTQRLYVDAPLAPEASLPLSREASHYLVTVLRSSVGDKILVFNGRDGEWLAALEKADRKAATLTLIRQTRPQPVVPDIDYIFAPVKSARLDYLVQKAVEMGANRLIPVITRHTQMARLNAERMQANIIEAAEQCGILNIPGLLPEIRLDTLLEQWDGERILIFCDKRAEADHPLAALQAINAQKFAVLIGPEGGFSAEERATLLKIPSVTRLSLGPRILRADTAGIAALALVQAVLGDWQMK
jgi:16S rRNA (uracil1498-N3)-methyltransferase